MWPAAESEAPNIPRREKEAIRRQGLFNEDGDLATPFRRLKEKKPTEIVRKAVLNMLPHNRLGRDLARHLRVYAGPEHPHQAQLPEPFTWGKE